MRIQSGAASTISQLPSTELDTAPSRLAEDVFEVTAEEAQVGKLANQHSVSPEMYELARKVEKGELSKADCAKEFVAVIIAQNGKEQSYGEITGDMQATIGDLLTNDPTFSNKIYQNLVQLARQVNN